MAIISPEDDKAAIIIIFFDVITTGMVEGGSNGDDEIPENWKAVHPHSNAEHGSASLPRPRRPIGGMCEAQRVDYLAACAGKITWRRYFTKWGGNQPGF